MVTKFFFSTYYHSLLLCLLLQVRVEHRVGGRRFDGVLGARTTIQSCRKTRIAGAIRLHDLYVVYSVARIGKRVCDAHCGGFIGFLYKIVLYTYNLYYVCNKGALRRAPYCLNYTKQRDTFGSRHLTRTTTGELLLAI